MWQTSNGWLLYQRSGQRKPQIQKNHNILALAIQALLAYTRQTMPRSSATARRKPIDPVYAELGRRVAAKREELGLTQLGLADQVGLSRETIANIERGRQQVLAHKVRALAQALRVGIVDLLPEAPRQVAVGEGLLDDQPESHKRFIKQALEGTSKE